jgi:hypothetical protein
LALAVVLGALSVTGAGGCQGAAPNQPAIEVSVDPGQAGSRVPPSFLGLAFEYDDILRYTGASPGPDAEILRLLGRLHQGDAGPYSIRIGGNSTDDTLWDPDGRPPPPGVRQTFDATWLQRVAAFLKALDASPIVGVNLRVNDPSVAGQWGASARAAFGPATVFEIGNEPNYYGTDRGIRGPGYSLDDYAAEYEAYARAIRAAAGADARLAGPGLLSSGWMASLPSFLSRESGRLDTVTYHQYPLSVCGKRPGDPDYPTIQELLSDTASHSIAAEAARFAEQAHQQGLAFRVDEMNSVVCFGADGVSNTFASALWLVDVLLEYLSLGVDGVNVQTVSHAYYTPLRPDASGWARNPEYDALQLVSEALAGRGRLLPTRVAGGAIKAWALLGPQGQVRVAVVDKQERAARVTVRVREHSGPGSLRRLQAASLGSRGSAWVGPVRINAAGGSFTFSFSGAGAVLLEAP